MWGGRPRPPPFDDDLDFSRVGARPSIDNQDQKLKDQSQKPAGEGSRPTHAHICFILFSCTLTLVV